MKKNKKTENLKKENKLNQLLIALILFIFGTLWLVFSIMMMFGGDDIEGYVLVHDFSFRIFMQFVFAIAPPIGLFACGIYELCKWLKVHSKSKKTKK